MNATPPARGRVAVIGGGPAGLMAAEVIARAGKSHVGQSHAGLAVSIFERMPSFGRKFLMAGRGGLNLTHSEPAERFAARYGDATAWMQPLLAAFPPAALIAWCEELGQPTFIGSSGRVFPKSMKASPLLRAWLRRLQALDVRLVPRAEWTGWDSGGALSFADGSVFAADAVVLTLGGASWPRLGADGGWRTLMPEIGVAPLRPANCGFKVEWSEPFRNRHAGAPLKSIAISFGGDSVRSEAVITSAGIEGGAIYALSALLREAIARDGAALLQIDLRPDLTSAEVARRLSEPRRAASLSNFLRKQLGLSPVAIGLIQEALHAGNAPPLPQLVKALPLRLTAPFDLSRAISTAGGIVLDELDERLMLRKRPGVFIAGEMLDWEAPTGGYLLQGCMATGAAAGRGAVEWLGNAERRG